MTATSRGRLLNSVPLRAELNGTERWQWAVTATPSAHILLIIDIESFSAVPDGLQRLWVQTALTQVLATVPDAVGLQFTPSFTGSASRDAHVAEHGQLPERDGETGLTSDFGGTDDVVFGCHPRASVFRGATLPVDSAPLVCRPSSPGQVRQEDARRARPGEAMPRPAVIAARSMKSEGTTMPRAVDPSLNRRKLRIALRQAREGAGLTQQETAQQLQWSPSKLIRIETGTVSTSVSDLRTLMGLYGITEPEQMRDLEEAARGSRGSSWWSSYRDAVSPEFVRYLGFEAAASSRRVYRPVLPVPDLSRAELLREPEGACGGFKCRDAGSWMVECGQVAEPCNAAGVYGGVGGGGLQRQSAGAAAALHQTAPLTWCPDDSSEVGRRIACLRLGSSTARTDRGLKIVEKVRNADLVLVISTAVPTPGTQWSSFSAELRFVWAPAGRDKFAACPDSPAAAPSVLFALSNRSCGIGTDGLGAPLARHVASTGRCGWPASLLEQAVGRPHAVRGGVVQRGDGGDRRAAPGCRPGDASSMSACGCRRGHGFSTCLYGPAVRRAPCSTRSPRQLSAPHVLPSVAAHGRQHTVSSGPGHLMSK